jgi:hypothetical protein
MWLQRLIGEALGSQSVGESWFVRYTLTKVVQVPEIARAVE